MNAESRKADLDQLMRYMVPESTAQDRAAAQGQFATRSGTRAFLADPDASPFAEAMSDRYNRSRAAVRMIGNYMDLAHVQGDYLPLRRHGDYIVTYGDRGTTDSPYGVHFFENRYDAEKARAQFQAEGKEPGEVFSKASRQGLRRVSPAELGALEQELVRQGRTPEEAASVRDVYATMLLKRVGDRTAARMGARREGVLGASTDMRRIDNEAYQNHAAHMGAMASMVERNQTLEQMQIRRDYLHRNGGGDPVRAQDVIDQLRKRMPTDDQTRFLNGTNANRIGKGLSNFGFIYTLLRPARMPLELVGMHAMNQAMLGGKYGAGVSIRATANASRLAGFGGSLRLGLPNMLNQMRGHINKVNWESSGVVAQRMIENGANPELVNKMRQALVDANLVDTSHAQVAAEMARANSNWNKVATLQDRTLGAFAQMDNAVETMARMVFAHAAAELELAKNRDGNLDRAVEAAVEHSRVVNPNWNAYNAPWVASSQGPLGALARPLFQFRNFGLHQFGLYANLIREAYRGGTEGQRGTAIKQLAGIIAYHALVGGLAVPGVEEVAKLLLGAADWVTGRRTPHDLDRIIRTHLADLMGPMAAQVATKGVLSLAGIDPSSSVGLHNLLQFPEFRDLTASEMAKNLAYMIVPASGQNIEQVAGAVQNFIRSGNPMALKNALPRMPRDLVGAYQMGTQGITDSRGKVILPSSQLSTGDIIAKAVGLRSTAESNFQEGRSAILDYQNVEKDERTRIINQAVASGNVGSVAAAVSKFNRDYPANPIKYDTLLKAQQEARQSTLTYGIRVPPKQVQDIRQQTRYLPQ
jgi:hypothetical protein